VAMAMHASAMIYSTPNLVSIEMSDCHSHSRVYTGQRSLLLSVGDEIILAKVR